MGLLAVTVNWDFLLSRAGEVLIVVAISFAVLTVLMSLYRYQTLMERSSSEGEAAPRFPDLEGDPLRLMVARRVGALTDRSRHFGLLLMDPTPLAGEQLERLADGLRKHIRSNDDLAVSPDGRIGILLETGIEGMRRCIERLDRVIRREYTLTDGEGKLRIGAAACPVHGRNSKALIDNAAGALDEPDNFPSTPGRDEPEDAEEEDLAASDRAMLDPLTEVLRPDKVASFMRKFLGQQRRGTELALFFLGLNNMEEIEEFEGEEAADAVRKGLSDIMKRALREEDILGRFDADHFLVLLLCSQDAAPGVARRLHETVRRERVEWQGRRLQVSINIGVSLCPEHGKNIPRLFRAAHAAYRTAVERGGSMCEVFGHSSRQTLVN
ncbi:GGDEF domain-containing protein [Kiritimatiella glycovorans]|uniref:Putative diguanylate cyclase YegE n=1 Tax=Kiritimatiella glycovorans TaxID=1307763 RepID=A0A0G3EFI0_9BACT|nr:GGDEF domain-containing protein [Kiritimatiella glycovorans]AKJ65108.1 putative diguanylate cyclase YegE [Kiritimatiella glycovorans]